ncbi:hypothetical protein F2Q68_00015550 [Brassica cretica]|uniref:Uncharacterized protein n=2 Tax=Brassica cretica TaxID=69181 RepID=A0A8S9RXA9_BRACR|nr:hypothetical protein F2Q68_00015550 [Brassica cretica]KAF3585083.1 hypothetical protein F2Q69_00029354 [Brassica cretica]KAF3608984.1 hypothetical protein DY000_02048157 [Brassica cretica]
MNLRSDTTSIRRQKMMKKKKEKKFRGKCIGAVILGEAMVTCMKDKYSSVVLRSRKLW